MFEWPDPDSGCDRLAALGELSDDLASLLRMPDKNCLKTYFRGRATAFSAEV